MSYIGGNALYGMDLTMAAISANVVGGTGNIRKMLLVLIVLYILYNALMLLGIQAHVRSEKHMRCACT